MHCRLLWLPWLPAQPLHNPEMSMGGQQPSSCTGELTLHHRMETCFCMPAVMSTWERMQLTHILEGLGGIGTPHRQQSLQGKGQTHMLDVGALARSTRQAACQTYT